MWVRVASTWAGNQLGNISVPRVGQEVLVSFLGGSPDMPVVVGSVFNEHNLPPWHQPDQQALTGIRSRELVSGGGNSAAGRSNALILDDTAEKIQVQLQSGHQTSQLSLGRITRITGNEGRTDARGDGFELRSDGQGAVRANGLLVTTEQRSNAAGHITDMGETTQRLHQGQAQHQGLAEFAAANQAQKKGDQDAVASAIKDQNAGITGTPGNNSTGFPEFAQPHLVLASPAGIATTTPHTTHVHSGEHIALSSGGHTSISATQSVLAAASQSIRMFALNNDIALVTANADIDLKALATSINLIAKLNITQTANRITITGTDELVFNGGGSYINLSAGGITGGTNGAFKMQSAGASLVGPSNMPANQTLVSKLCSIKAGAASQAGDASVAVAV